MVDRLVARAQTSSSALSDPTAEAIRRLRLICMWVSIAPAFKLVLGALLLPPDSPQRVLVPRFLSLVLGMSVSAILYVVLGRESIARERRLDIGFGYQAFLALLAALYRHQQPWLPGEGFRDFSPVAALVLIFAAFIPNAPRRTFAASLVAAAMDPVGLFIWAARGNPMPPLGQAIGLCIPSLGAAIVATLVSRVLYGLARNVEHARQLGSYRLDERLGAGGMGEVWRASHHLLARPAAVKLIRPENAHEEGVLRRFEREARATAALTSPHTIHLYDFGVTDDGTFYYVMELLDGVDLEALVTKHGPLPPERVIHVLLEVCASLDEAHDRGLVHRDIKPANVYVCRYGRQVDFVKVLDFGLVKPSGGLAEPELGPAVTAVGTLAGTPAFIAPELVLGEADIDGRADLYAVGCLAYWLLTGQFVFEATTAMKMVLAHAHEAPSPPSQHTELPIPPALDQIVLDCLEKDPAKRPQTAEALAKRLEEVPLERAWTRDRARRWWDLHLPSTELKARASAA